MTSVPIELRDTKTRERLEAERKGSSFTPLKVELTKEWWSNIGFNKLPL